MTFRFDRADTVHRTAASLIASAASGPDTVMGVIYRCAIKLRRADRLTIGDGLRGDSCLRCAAGLREAIDAGIRTRIDGHEGDHQRASDRPVRIAPRWSTCQELTQAHLAIVDVYTARIITADQGGSKRPDRPDQATGMSHGQGCRQIYHNPLDLAA